MRTAIPTTTGVLASSPSGADIFLASPDGTVALYTAAANTFVDFAARFHVTFRSFAASDFGQYIVGNTILDASLVPAGTVSASPLPTSGFTFVSRADIWLQPPLLRGGGQHGADELRPNAGAATVSLAGCGSALLPVAGSSPVQPVRHIRTATGPAAPALHAMTSFSRTVAPHCLVRLDCGDEHFRVLPFCAASLSGRAMSVHRGRHQRGRWHAAGGSGRTDQHLRPEYEPAQPGGQQHASVHGARKLLYRRERHAHSAPVRVSPQQINAQLPFNADGTQR